ncbi:pyridoxal phosphate-dependent aminotransferase [Terrabacter sp. MAHUQ-38]|nr:pyridoxal phosphate-dependent aminotransferase [Terrabacter sp. MAHUQ-38]
MSPAHTSQRANDIAQVSRRPALKPAAAGTVSLAMGEPDFPTPAQVSSAGIAAIERGETHYADQNGLPQLRQAIAARTTLQTGRPYAPEQVVVTHGGTGGLSCVFLGLVDPGARVVMPEPTYSLYADLVALVGAEPVLVPLADDLHWDLDALAAALPGADAFVFCNPCNPTGIVHTAEELQFVARLLDGTDTLVISDEAYSGLVFGDATYSSVLNVPGLAERALLVQTFSKTYAMTGWRIGYVVAPQHLVAPIARIHRTINGSLATFTQHAALAALELTEAELMPMVTAYAERRDFAIQLLSGRDDICLGSPEGAFYAFLRYPYPVPSEAVANDLSDRGVLVRAGAEYGPHGEHAVRISFATSKASLRQGIDIICRYLDELADRHGQPQPTV